MIQIDQLKQLFPPILFENATLRKYLLKEYLQLRILDFLSTSHYIKKIVFIGGTNLRLIKGIDRFSEDLDFDCKDLLKDDFMAMTDSIVLYLQRFGFTVETRDKENDKLKAFRRALYFPGLLYNMGLSQFRDERFLIKIEIQDQRVEYPKKMVQIKKAGFFFTFPVPPDEVICAMKITALLSRQKGRDFYDTIFLLSQTKPDFGFLFEKKGISNMLELKTAFQSLLEKTNLAIKAKDFKHLVFEERNAEKILLFQDFVNSME